MIKLKLTRHFEDMMQYRGVDMDHVKKAMREPDSTESTYDGKMKNKKVLEDGRTIAVVHSAEGFRNADARVMITAYYSSNE